MFAFLKQKSIAVNNVGVCFGKLPGLADFIRSNTSHEVVQECDAWIQRALEQMSGVDEWVALYDQIPAVDFCFSGRHPMKLMGVLAPSQDSAGRRYPLLAARIEADQVEPGAINANQQAVLSLVPVACEALHTSLRRKFNQIGNAFDNRAVVQECRDMCAQIEPDYLLASEIVRQFLRTTTLGSLFAQVANEHPEVDQETFFLNLTFSVDFARRYNDAVFNQMLRLPLSSDSGCQAPYASFWLAAISALLGEQNKDCNFIIARTQGRGDLLVSVREMPDKGLMALAGRGVGRGAEVDLVAEHDVWRSHRAYADMSYAISRMCADPDLPLESLLEFFGELGKTLIKDS